MPIMTIPRKLIANRFSPIEIINTIIFEGDEKILEFLTLSCLAIDYCQTNGVSIEESSIDQVVNQIRRQNKLFTADDTEKFLAANCLSDQDLRNHARVLAEIDILKKSIASASDVEHYFKLNKLRFDEVELYKLVVKSLSAATELRTQILEGASFFELTRKYSIDMRTRPHCGYVGRVRRDTLPALVESQVFSPDASRLIGPTKLFGTYHLYFIEKVYRAALDDDTIQQEIADLLVQDWLSNSLDQLGFEKATVLDESFNSPRFNSLDG
ncbi:MAG: peptidylprolyl isomerase [Candidatus Obscuribacterales bacterium]|nr:peptidylprolyl isomerase [Candidatus Obscuribacterales bacterium]